jgi:SH3-like domain-containing protein
MAKQQYKKQMTQAAQILGRLQSRVDAISDRIKEGSLNAETVNHREAATKLQLAWSFYRKGKPTDCVRSCKEGLQCISTR